MTSPSQACLLGLDPVLVAHELAVRAVCAAFHPAPFPGVIVECSAEGANVEITVLGESRTFLGPYLGVWSTDEQVGDAARWFVHHVSTWARGIARRRRRSKRGPTVKNG